MQRHIKVPTSRGSLSGVSALQAQVARRHVHPSCSWAGSHGSVDTPKSWNVARSMSLESLDACSQLQHRLRLQPVLLTQINTLQMLHELCSPQCCPEASGWLQRKQHTLGKALQGHMGSLPCPTSHVDAQSHHSVRSSKPQCAMLACNK